MNKKAFYGSSSRAYDYELYHFDSTNWNAAPVNYLFAAPVNGEWFIPYAGETDDARCRFSNHERWNEAVQRWGATHIFVHVAPNEAARKAEERDLILSLDPPMNEKHKPKTGLINLAPGGFFDTQPASAGGLFSLSPILCR